MGKATLTVISGIVLVLIFSLACSAVSAVSYVAAQTWTTPAAVPETDTLEAPSTAESVPAETPAPEATAVPLDENADPAAPVEEGAGGNPNAEEEYYRAVFDVCMYSASQAGVSREKAVEGCRDFVRRSINGNWFNEPSQNWEWPLPAVMSGGPSA